MRVALALVLLLHFQTQLLAETAELPAKPTVLPHGQPLSANRAPLIICEVEVGKSLTIRHFAVPIPATVRRDPNAILITCNTADSVQEAGNAVTLDCTSCKVKFAGGAADAPKAIVDMENNRLTLIGTKKEQVKLTLGESGQRRAVFAEKMDLEINGLSPTTSAK